MKKSREKAVFAAKIGILAALAAVVQLLEFSLPLFPEFLKIDLSEVVGLTGAFALGPVAGILIELIKNLLHILFKGTSSVFVGEFANFLVGVAMVFPAGLVYQSHKSRTGALAGSLTGTAAMTAAGAFLNYYLLIPAYAVIHKWPLEEIVAAAGTVNGNVTDLRTLIVFAVLPFNLLKGLICTLITFLIYKKVSPILHVK